MARKYNRKNSTETQVETQVEGQVETQVETTLETTPEVPPTVEANTETPPTVQPETAPEVTVEANTETPPNPEIQPEPVKISTIATVEYSAAEALVQAQYKHLHIIPGSLIQEVNHDYFKNKRRVKVKCPCCPAIVERATSDLFTFKGCPVCLKGIRKANKAKKRLAAINAADASDDGEE